MGFNFAGIAITGDFDNNLEKLSKSLNLSLEELIEDTIDSIFGSIDETEAYVYFGKKGALIFLAPSLVIEHGLPDDALSFVIAETSDSYYLETQNTYLDIRIGEVLEQKNISLNQDYTNHIFSQIEVFCGTHFYDITEDDTLLFCEIVE